MKSRTNEVLMDSPEDLAAYRVRRLARQAEMMSKMITKPEDSDVDALFPNYAAVLTVAALFGYSTGSYKADFGKSRTDRMGEPVQRQFFTSDQLKLIDLIAYAHTREPTIIRRKEKFEIFSAYAAAGFDYMCKMLDADARDWSSSRDVMECGKRLAEIYLGGSKTLSPFETLA